MLDVCTESWRVTSRLFFCVIEKCTSGMEINMQDSGIEKEQCTAEDEKYMRRALELAKKGAGHVNPNPMVGAVLVKNGRVIGEGCHERFGELHAERNALKNCSESPNGAVLYVTLEPCCHYGKTPPCTEAIIENKIRRVVVGSFDSNPLVAGKGIRILKDAGIGVTEGILQKECDELNRIFFHFMKTGTPYVMMKYAMTMDGKIATYTGASKWITGDTARARVQEDRGRFMAIMAGVGTVLADNPLLTCRLEGKKSPIRIICDTHLRTPFSSALVQTAKEVPVILATACNDAEKKDAFVKAGCEVLTLPEKDGGVDLNALMKVLGKRQIDSVLLEGGGTLNFTALKSGIVDRVQAYIAPKLFGGANAKTPVEGKGVALPKEAFRLENPKVLFAGEDIVIESDIVRE